ncbi:MAG: succinylglutamate desuccinylase/aspartoacylase family protein [Betaproteobacteria bacterium]|nr:succinylglutamate desuccinylase/aspartoacylase family protein [Betaproteobacteria bacterium]
MTEQSPFPSYHFKSISCSGTKPGPRLIVLGAVHGNETCGMQAITRVLDDIDAGRLNLSAGTVTFVPITNPLAYQRRERAGDRNLNRNLYPVAEPKDFEDHIANWLCPLLANHDVLLDLHSTRAQNPAFAMLGPENNSGSLQPFTHNEKERALALRLGVKRFVEGWLSTYAKGVNRRVRETCSAGQPLNPLNTDPRYGVGTTEYMRSVGGYSVTLECGQHDDPSSPEVGYRAILNTLAHLGMTASPSPPPVTEYEALRMYEVHDKNHEGDTFSRAWASFDPLHKGDLIATRHDGTQLLAEDDGCILFPDAQAVPGNEWFYLTKTIQSIQSNS